MEIDFVLKSSVDEDSDKFFVSETLAVGMVSAWLEPQVKTILLTKQFIGGKEEKFYSQANHLSQLQSLLADTKSEFRKLIRDYGYLNNTYLNNTITKK